MSYFTDRCCESVPANGDMMSIRITTVSGQDFFENEQSFAISSLSPVELVIGVPQGLLVTGDESSNAEERLTVFFQGALKQAIPAAFKK
jgi:hypothetical protein